MEDYPQNQNNNLSNSCLAMIAGFAGGSLVMTIVFIVLFLCLTAACVFGFIWIAETGAMLL